MFLVNSLADGWVCGSLSNPPIIYRIPTSLSAVVFYIQHELRVFLVVSLDMLLYSLARESCEGSGLLIRNLTFTMTCTLFSTCRFKMNAWLKKVIEMEMQRPLFEIG